MLTLEKLIKSVPPVHVLEVVVGIHSTLVKTVDNCGIANTIKHACPHENVQQAGNLEQLNLHELAEFALSDNLLEASVGMAAINCAFSARINKYHSVNAKDIILEKGRDKIVGIIGHFPFLEQQKEHYKECYIFEKQPQKGDLLESDIPDYLPKVDVAAITATSLTNHTFDGILQNLSRESFNIILGPSTPLAPILFNSGIDAISGTLVEDYELVKKYVQQASPTRYLKGIKYVTILKEDYL